MSLRYQGMVETRSNSRIKGWCCSLAKEPGFVKVYVNNEFRGDFPAYVQRQDLKERGLCITGGGFEIDASALVTFGQSDFRITDPDGCIVLGGEFTLNYRSSILGEASFIIGDLSGKTIGLFGNARFARDTSIGTCMSKILHCIGANTVDEPAVDTATVNLWHCFPHRQKPKGYSNTINFHLSDISKSAIDKHHWAIFGRGICVDPSNLSDDVLYVIKSEQNAAHDGRVKLGRDIRPEDADGAVIQRLINNRNSENTVLDLRVPVIGDDIPHVILKVRSINNRFSNSNHSATVTRTENIFSAKERSEILEFCRSVRLQYGELDVLRDAETGEIWIVDVNNTPAGPANGLSQSDQNSIIREQAISFYLQFLK